MADADLKSYLSESHRIGALGPKLRLGRERHRGDSGGLSR
jgi:hypothetical protein